MRLNGILYLFVVVALTACSMKPIGIIGDKKMENIIYDMTFCDAVLSSYNISSPNERQAYYDKIYAKYNTTADKFQQSLEWYARNPKRLEQIYTNVKTRIDNLQADVESYKFHPESKLIDELKALDTVNIYRFADSYRFTSNPKNDSLRFEIADPAYFAESDRFILKFFMRVNDTDTVNDTLKNSRISLRITYSDGTVKQLFNNIFANNRWYRYTFSPQSKPNIAPIKVEGNLFEANTKITNLQIDSAKLLRIFNAEKYPLPDSIKTALNVNEKEIEAMEEEEAPQLDISTMFIKDEAPMEEALPQKKRQPKSSNLKMSKSNFTPKPKSKKINNN